jgi:hypothetical protein
LVPSQGIGGVRAKIKRFISVRYGKDETKLLTVDQWTDLLSFMEKTVEASGASALVSHIDKVVGAA